MCTKRGTLLRITFFAGKESGRIEINSLSITIPRFTSSFDLSTLSRKTTVALFILEADKTLAHHHLPNGQTTIFSTHRRHHLNRMASHEWTQSLRLLGQHASRARRADGPKTKLTRTNNNKAITTKKSKKIIREREEKPSLTLLRTPSLNNHIGSVWERERTTSVV